MHGEWIDSGVDLDRMDVYNYIVYYFDNPIMEKIKDVDGMSLFGCKIRTLLKKDHKYIFALVRSGKIKDTRVHLQDIEWDIFQTRTIEDVYSISQHSFVGKSDDISTSPISVFKKDDRQYTYASTKFNNIIVALLFSKNQTRPFSDRGTLGLALDNFNTIISFS